LQTISQLDHIFFNFHFLKQQQQQLNVFTQEQDFPTFLLQLQPSSQSQNIFAISYNM